MLINMKRTLALPLSHLTSQSSAYTSQCPGIGEHDTLLVLCYFGTLGFKKLGAPDLDLWHLHRQTGPGLTLSVLNASHGCLCRGQESPRSHHAHVSISVVGWVLVWHYRIAVGR